ncbi:MAG: hypothetical protein RLZZ175_1819 [Bacteroidota bacterium]|jgi:hypothetical protein
MRAIKVYIIFLLITFSNIVLAQNNVPILEKKISVSVSNQLIVDIFKIINEQTGINFSYNPSVFNDKKRITLNYKKVPLRVVLDAIFKETNCSYKIKKNYLLIIPNVSKSAPQKVNEIPTLTLRGYIYNSKDSSVVENTSVYIKDGRFAALTNQYGYFELKVNKYKQTVTFKIAKENFKDTTITISGTDNQSFNVYLNKIENPLISNSFKFDTLKYDTIKKTEIASTIPEVKSENSDSVFVKKYIKYIAKFRDFQQNFVNIKDTLQTQFAFAILPMISTNKLLSINTVNSFSLNLLVGYSKGSKILEIGGLANIDIGNIENVQIAGITNLVKGNVSGVQIAGIANHVHGNVKGVQSSGIYNLVTGKFNGVQLGGSVNIVNDDFEGVQIGSIVNSNIAFGNFLKLKKYKKLNYLDGFQISGVVNLADSVKGFQVAGNVNLVNNIQGFQIAGNVNAAREVNGFQIAGLVNYANRLKGFQITSLVNVAKDTLEGFQITSLVNFARKLKGVQIALINIADSCESGAPIGLISFVRKGFNKLEFSLSEIFTNKLTLRTGVAKFHNIFGVGANWSGGNELVLLTYGLGSKLQLYKKWYFNADITSSRNIEFTNKVDRNIHLYKLFAGIEFQVFNKLSFVVGPTINLLNMDIKKGNTENLISILPHRFSSFSAKTADGGFTTNQWWFGLQGAVRF